MNGFLIANQVRFMDEWFLKDITDKTHPYLILGKLCLNDSHLSKAYIEMI